MYTLVLDETNELKTTVRERIMQRSKLVDSLHFLIDPVYKGLDMADFTVMLEYILPVSREYHTEVLVKSDELYKEKLEYKLPFDTSLTKEAGDIEIQLTMLKVSLDADGNSIQQVRKTSPTVITILPISAWSDIIADSTLTALDQRLLQTQAMLNAANEMANYLDDIKADNMIYNEEGKYLQLTSHGTPIGDQIKLDGIGVNIVSIEVDEEGNMIVHYSDGRVENIGQVGGCDSCPGGVYIPSYEENTGIMTFTLKEKVEEPIYSWDINKSNNWTEVSSPEEFSDFIWEEL